MLMPAPPGLSRLPVVSLRVLSRSVLPEVKTLICVAPRLHLASQELTLAELSPASTRCHVHVFVASVQRCSTQANRQRNLSLLTQMKRV